MYLPDLRTLVDYANFLDIYSSRCEGLIEGELGLDSIINVGKFLKNSSAALEVERSFQVIDREGYYFDKSAYLRTFERASCSATLAVNRTISELARVLGLEEITSDDLPSVRVFDYFQRDYYFSLHFQKTGFGYGWNSDKFVEEGIVVQGDSEGPVIRLYLGTNDFIGEAKILDLQGIILERSLEFLMWHHLTRNSDPGNVVENARGAFARDIVNAAVIYYVRGLYGLEPVLEKKHEASIPMLSSFYILPGMLDQRFEVLCDSLATGLGITVDLGFGLKDTKDPFERVYSDTLSWRNTSTNELSFFFGSHLGDRLLQRKASTGEDVLEVSGVVFGSSLTDSEKIENFKRIAPKLTRLQKLYKCVLRR